MHSQKSTIFEIRGHGNTSMYIRTKGAPACAHAPVALTWAQCDVIVAPVKSPSQAMTSNVWLSDWVAVSRMSPKLSTHRMREGNVLEYCNTNISTQLCRLKLSTHRMREGNVVEYCNTNISTQLCAHKWRARSCFVPWLLVYAKWPWSVHLAKREARLKIVKLRALNHL